MAPVLLCVSGSGVGVEAGSPVVEVFGVSGQTYVSRASVWEKISPRAGSFQPRFGLVTVEPPLELKSSQLYHKRVSVKIAIPAANDPSHDAWN